MIHEDSEKSEVFINYAMLMQTEVYEAWRSRLAKHSVPNGHAVRGLRRLVSLWQSMTIRVARKIIHAMEKVEKEVGL
jgi:hypothetical protein